MHQNLDRDVAFDNLAGQEHRSQHNQTPSLNRCEETNLCLVNYLSTCRVSFWLRHGGHLRCGTNHSKAMEFERRFAWPGHGFGPLRHRAWLVDWRLADGPVWAQADFDFYRHSLRDFGDRLRVRGRSRAFRLFPLYWRSGD